MALRRSERVRLGAFVRERRLALGLNQDGLAALVTGFDRSAISKVETGQRGLGNVTRPRFAAALRVTEAELLEAAQGPTEPEPTLRELVDRQQSLADEVSQSVLAFREEILAALERLSDLVLVLVERSAPASEPESGQGR